MSSAIIAPILQAPDWASIASQPNHEASNALRAVLAHVEGIEEHAFAVRGWALRMIEERELFRLDLDLEIGQPFVSMDRWLKQMHPRNHRYYRESLTAAKALSEIPFADFAAIPRCNVEQLKRVSGAVRVLPAVVQAAKQMPEKSFVAKLNQDHNQHLEVKHPIVMATPDDVEEFETAIAIALVVEGCANRSEAIRAISISYIQEHAVEAEHLSESA